MTATVATPFKQDMPPSEGFGSVKYKRHLPIRGPGAYAILGLTTLVSAWGLWRVGQGNQERKELAREQVWSRIHLVPLIMAEGDRDIYRRQQASLEREKEIMKDVPGWKPGESVYNDPRYHTPEYALR